MHKFKKGDFVVIRLSSQGPVRMRVLELVRKKDAPFYKLDWGSCGFNSILNTISIAEKAVEREAACP
jgi:hypothetical protein